MIGSVIASTPADGAPSGSPVFRAAARRAKAQCRSRAAHARTKHAREPAAGAPGSPRAGAGTCPCEPRHLRPTCVYIIEWRFPETLGNRQCRRYELQMVARTKRTQRKLLKATRKIIRQRDSLWSVDPVRKKLYLLLANVVDKSDWVDLTRPLKDRLDPKETESWKARMGAYGIKVSASDASHLQRPMTVEQVRRAENRWRSPRAFRTTVCK